MVAETKLFVSGASSLEDLQVPLISLKPVSQDVQRPILADLQSWQLPILGALQTLQFSSPQASQVLSSPK